MTTNWTDVKNDPVQRIVYHNDNFQELTKNVDDITKSMLSNADSISDKTTVQILRMLLDGMVKCFDQFYYDVNSGFPGYKPAVWQKTDTNTVKAKLSLAQLTMIEEALDYATEQVNASLIPVFDSFANTCTYTYDDGTVETWQDYDGEAVAAVIDEVAMIKANLSLLYPHDGGIIEINA